MPVIAKKLLPLAIVYITVHKYIHKCKHNFVICCIISFRHEDDDLLSEPCMANMKKTSKTVKSAVNKLKKARSRMKVITIDTIACWINEA